MRLQTLRLHDYLQVDTIPIVPITLVGTLYSPRAVVVGGGICVISLYAGSVQVPPLWATATGFSGLMICRGGRPRDFARLYRGDSY